MKNIPQHELLKSPRNIVVTRLQYIGDMLAFVPFLKSLRGAYPDANITLITRNNLGYETIEGCPYLDRIIKAGRGAIEKIRFIRELRRIKPDIFILSTSEFGKVKWGVMAGAKIIVGYKKLYFFNKEREIKWPNFITLSPSFDNNKNEIENNLDLLRTMGIREVDSSMEYSWILDKDRSEVNNLLLEEGISNNDIVVLLSPGTKQKTKRWIPERFAQLADRIVERFKARIIISGSKEETEESDMIRSLVKFPVISLAGKTTLKQLPALIDRCDVIVTVDSGPMHFAAALQKPLVALFGPGDYIKWAHIGNPAKWNNIYKKVNCSPCEKRHCEDLKCMKLIEVEEVFEKVSRILESFRK